MRPPEQHPRPRLLRYGNGDAAAFEALYAAEAQGLYGFLTYRTGDRSLAEDLLADTFERALRKRKRYDAAKGTQRTWLYAIALNLLRDNALRFYGI